MSRIPFIQVGVANRGATVLRDLQERYADRFEPVAFVDVEPTFLDAARVQTGRADVATYTTLADALAGHPDAEAVVVVTPARYHAMYIREALHAGKHVWVEKPLTYDYTEALALADLARQRQRAVVVGNQYQYHPLERQLQRIVQEQRYGRPCLLTYIHHRHRPQMRAFTGHYPALWEQGVHSLNSILAILGHPPLSSVYALSQKPPHSNYRSDTITSSLTQFADGTQVYVLNTFDSHRSDWRIRLECTEAALLVGADGWQRDAIQVLADEKVVETLHPAADLDDALRDPYAAFYTAITTGQTTPTSIEVNLQTIQWIDAVARSIESKQVVTL